MKLSRIGVSILLLAVAPAAAFGGSGTNPASNGPVEAARFVYEDGGFVEVSGAGSVDVSRTSTLAVRANFTSDRVLPTTGQFLVDELAFRWRFLSGSTVLPLESGPDGWIGGSLLRPGTTLIHFDRVTGQGTVSIPIPIGWQPSNSEVRFPLLPEVADSVEICLGWADSLTIDSAGVPEGAFWTTSLAVLGNAPDVWIDPLSRVVPIGASHTIVLLTREDLGAARSYVIHNPWPDEVRFDTAFGSTAPLTVQLEAGEWAFAVPIRAIDTGVFQLEVRRPTGELLATTEVMTSSNAMGASLDRLLSVEGGLILAGSVVDVGTSESLMQDPIPTTSMSKRCSPAEGVSSPLWGQTSECKPAHSAGGACPEALNGPYISAKCTFHVWKMCLATTNVVTTFQYDLDSWTFAPCTVGGWSVSGAISAGWRAVSAGISGTYTPPSGTKLVCNYKKNPATATTHGKRGCYEN